MRVSAVAAVVAVTAGLVTGGPAAEARAASSTASCFEVAFQANTGSLWTVGGAGSRDWHLGMRPGTSPAVAGLAGGGVEVAFQANTGSLWTVGSAGYRDWGVPMMAGTSPAIVALPAGGFVVAYQSDAGLLNTVGAGGSRDWHLGLKAGTSPAITYLPGVGYQVAFQANTGSLWTVGAAGYRDWHLGLRAGTSPAISGVGSGRGFEVAFQANTGSLWTVGSAGNRDWGLAMQPASSPAVADVPPSFEVAVQDASGSLHTASGSGQRGWQLGLRAATSPGVAALGSGGYEVAFQANTGSLWTVGSAGNRDWGLGMAAGTSPSIAALAGCASGGTPTAARPCGSTSRPPTRVDHVVWVFLENKEEGQVIGSPAAPYLNRLADQCGLTTDYHGVTHPSLPNYLAAVSGSTGGVTSDCSPSTCPQSRPTVFSELDGQGRGWATYAESMPANCDTTSGGQYAARHNPAVYFPALRATCRHDDVPLTALPSALDSGTLPPFALVVPNLCNDMHDCSVATGDHWLSQWVPRVLSSSAYRSGRSVLVITFDEGFGASNTVATVVVSPSTRPGTRSATRFDHYSLLRTTEELLGLPLLGAAGQAASMRAAFNL